MAALLTVCEIFSDIEVENRHFHPPYSDSRPIVGNAQQYQCNPYIAAILLQLLLLRPRRRRLEAFTTDSKIIRLISRRVAIFPAAAARQIFDGDCDATQLIEKKIPW